VPRLDIVMLPETTLESQRWQPAGYFNDDGQAARNQLITPDRGIDLIWHCNRKIVALLVRLA
jgi:hypothetical protein